ncbi:MAG: hypothetical protein HKN11_04450 [Rhizobiales bacterium]|nr:hypothetical protein [Hyphomicrobiales bacterium]
MNGSFHALDVEHFGPHNVVSISSKPEWNQLAQNRGVEHVVPKSFSDLDGFAEDVADLVLDLLRARSA